MINKVILLGNLGQDPEIRYSQNGSKIATFSLATSDFWKDRETGERKTITQWHRIVVFNPNLSNIVEQYVKKGSKIYLEGALQHRKYTANDGSEKFITEVVLTQFKGEIKLLDSREEVGFSSERGNLDSFKKTPTQKSTNDQVTNIGDDLDDEIPF